MSVRGSRTAAYTLALVLSVPLAALAFFVAGYVGWLGVVVASGVTGLAAWVVWTRREPQRLASLVGGARARTPTKG
jgi:hypothetical protein